jgi:hypothetical protein
VCDARQHTQVNGLVYYAGIGRLVRRKSWIQVLRAACTNLLRFMR